MSHCPSQPLPEPYPEDVRRARWAPFWEALEKGRQARLDSINPPRPPQWCADSVVR